MMYAFALSLSLFCITCGIVQAAPVRRSACPDLKVVYVPGTGETGLATNGESFEAALLKVLPDAQVEPLDYDTSEEYLLTPVLAAGLLSAGLTQDVQNCPKTVFALVGYSKGAMVVHETGLPADIKSKVVAVVVFGDPFTEETGMAFERTEGMTEGIGEVWPIEDASAAMAYCNDNDPICDGGDDEEAHLTYHTNGSVEKAAAFIAEHVEL